MSSLYGVIENEIRPQIQRLTTADRKMERRVGAVEDWMSGIDNAIVDMKNDLGASLSMVIAKLDKLADKVGAER